MNKILVALVAVFLAIVGVGAYVMLGLTKAPASAQCTPSTVYGGPTVKLLFIEDHTGINGSVTKSSAGRPWPCVGVKKGTTLNITVRNLDAVEPHGFAIDHYFDVGVPLRPGASYSLSFVASKDGQYTIFCNIFCSIHVYMIGDLMVIP